MNNRDQLTKEIEAFIDDLAMPLSNQEIVAGWTPESQIAILKLLHEIHASIVGNQPVGKISLGRGLDSWGIESGHFLERACVISNKIRELID